MGKFTSVFFISFVQISKKRESKPDDPKPKATFMVKQVNN